MFERHHLVKSYDDSHYRKKKTPAKRTNPEGSVEIERKCGLERRNSHNEKKPGEKVG